jgi:hypothetical protein
MDIQTGGAAFTSSFQAFMLLPSNVSASSINKRLLAFSNEHYNADKKGYF